MRNLVFILAIFFGLTLSCENGTEIEPENISNEISMSGTNTSQTLSNNYVKLYDNPGEDHGETISKQATATVSTGDKVSIVIKLNGDLQPITVHGKSDLFENNQSLIGNIRDDFLNNPAYSTDCETELTCCGEERECNDKPSDWGVAGCWAGCAIDVTVEAVEDFIDEQGW